MSKKLEKRSFKCHCLLLSVPAVAKCVLAMSTNSIHTASFETPKTSTNVWVKALAILSLCSLVLPSIMCTSTYGILYVNLLSVRRF